MRCITCEKISLPLICKKCQKTLLTPNLTKRYLDDDFLVFSFYSYEEIKGLINSKYEIYGHNIYKIICNNSTKLFAKEFTYDGSIDVIGIDDYPTHEFSQTAMISKSLKSEIFKPKFGVLKAKNRVKYAGQNLEFRKSNPRNFIYSGKKNRQVILVDDIITTGLTLLEAKKVLQSQNCEVLFAITLCNAKL